MLSGFSRVWLYATLWTVDHQASLSMGFSRQEYWSGLPCPSPGENLPNPGMEPASLTSPALAGRFFTTSATWWLIFKLVTRDERINLYIESQIFTSSAYSSCFKLDLPWMQRFLHALVCEGCHNYHRVSGDRSLFPQFWRLEVQSPHVSRVDFFWGLSPWLAASACGLCSAPRHPWCLCVCV